MAQNNMGPIIGNQGIITQGQTGNNTIIQGQAPRHLLDVDKAGLRENILKNQKVILEVHQGDSDNAGLADEVTAFLVSEGHEVEGPKFAMMIMANGAPRGIGLYPNKNPSEPAHIIVGNR